MGSSYAAALVRGGHDVEVLEADPRVVELLRDGGVTVVEPGGAEHALRLTATLDPADVARGPDVVLVFVKAYDGAAAARAAAPLVGPDTIVATVQNGWGHGELLPSTCRPSARSGRRGGHAPTPSARSTTRTGRRSSGRGAPGAARAPRRRSPRCCARAAWRHPRSRMRGRGSGSSSSTPPTPRCRRSPGSRCRASPPARTPGRSARRSTEVAVINGAVVAAAERHGADAPLHRAALALIGGIEASWNVG